MNRNSPPALRKSLMTPGQVVQVGDVVLSLPPERRETEWKLRQPDECQAEHPEEHPRADSAGRGLADESRSPKREEAGRGDRRQRAQEGVDAEKRLIARGAIELGVGEEVMRVEVR